MSKMFEPFKIGSMEIKNRFVRSATVDNLGKDQMVTEIQEKFYSEMARGEVGLIISHGLFPALDGWSAEGQLGIYKDEMIPSLKKLTKAVHDNGGKIAAQLMHAGWFGNPALSGFQNVGPSRMFNPSRKETCRELSNAEVYEHIEQFVQAGRRAIEAGFDAVQIHAAHGWFVSSFLSPVTNHRTDEFGGTAEKRAAFLIKTIQGLRQMACPGYPIMIKIGLKDYHPQGKSVSEGIDSINLCIAASLDAIEVSEGVEETPFHHIRKDGVQPYYVEECREARKFTKKPLILVGGMRKLADMQSIVDGDIADAVSACRPYIMDQHIVKKMREGTIDGSACTSCNLCSPKMHERNLHCVFNKQLINY